MYLPSRGQYLLFLVLLLLYNPVCPSFSVWATNYGNRLLFSSFWVSVIMKWHNFYPIQFLFIHLRDIYWFFKLGSYFVLDPGYIMVDKIQIFINVMELTVQWYEEILSKVFLIYQLNRETCSSSPAYVWSLCHVPFEYYPPKFIYWCFLATVYKCSLL